MSEKRPKKITDKKRLSHGSYSILMTAIVVTAVLFLNFLVNRLPVQMTQIDFSSAKLYTLTDTTRQFLEELDEDVTLYYICEGGKEDDTVEKLLRRYQDESSHIEVEQIDPALYPGFTKTYTEESLENNSVIVAGNEISKVVKAQDMYASGYSTQTGGYVNKGFDGEGRVTSAIGYVTSEDIPVLYVLNGNGEGTLGNSFLDAVQKNNIDVQTLNLLTAEAIPEDASAILINSPAKDYTDEETKEIIRYLENGGKALIYSTFSLETMPNFDSILADYGLERVEGIVLESDTNCYTTYQYCIFPGICYSEVTKDVYDDTFLLAPMSQGIRATDTYRSSIGMQTLLVSSASSYSKTDVENMTTSEKEEEDIDGPFNVGILVQEDIDNDHEVDTEVVYYSTGYLLDEDYNQNVSGGNARLFGSTVSYLCKDDEAAVDVPVKTLQVPYLTMTSFTANFWTVICVFVLPLAFVLAGVIKWLKRRNG